MLQYIREKARKNPFFRKLIGYHIASSGFFDAWFRNYEIKGAYARRVQAVLDCPDLKDIPRSEQAGEIHKGTQVMHNGLKIYTGSYYGPEITKMLYLSKGVHEPQEEKVFEQVLKALPAGAVMIEMGAFWSFYSMWFQQKVPGAVNYMIEPEAFNLGQGKRNFKLNQMKGTFIQAMVGKESAQNELGKLVCIDDFLIENNIPFVHMLHSDIQGFEMDMLEGAEQSFDDQKLGYVFISTHSNKLHKQCLEFLDRKGFIIIAQANLDDSYSEDGLIAARAPWFPGLDSVSISHRSVDVKKNEQSGTNQ